MGNTYRNNTKMAMGTLPGPSGQSQPTPNNHRTTKHRYGQRGQGPLDRIPHQQTEPTSMIPWQNLENFSGDKEDQHQPKISSTQSYGRPSGLGLLGKKGQIMGTQQKSGGLGYNQKGHLQPNDHHASMDNKVHHGVLCYGLPDGTDEAMTNCRLPPLQPPQ